MHFLIWSPYSDFANCPNCSFQKVLLRYDRHTINYMFNIYNLIRFAYTCETITTIMT